VRRSVCLVVDADASMLVGLAGYGVRSEDVELFSTQITDDAAGLVAALTSPQALQFRGTRPNGTPARTLPPSPLGVTGPFVAHPLRGARDQEQALGLLLIRAGA